MFERKERGGSLRTAPSLTSTQEGDAVAYRDFDMPAFARGQHSAFDWMDWMVEQGDILIPVAPMHPRTCRVCLGAVGVRYDGDTWATCQHCAQYGAAIDEFVPITYSIDAGIEGMLHRYKDQGVHWLNSPLGVLLYVFLRRHAGCLEGAAGGIDLATAVPSNDRARSFNQLDRMMRGVVEKDPVLAMFEWDLSLIERNFATSRPARGELKPEAYVVPGGALGGESVLLLDDLWTSGSSTASAAAALKDAGARHVTVLTIGRHLHAGSGFGTTQEILDDRRDAEWSSRACVLCS